MEVRTTEVPSASLKELRPGFTVPHAPRDGGGDQFSRIANTATKVLDVPFACISIPHSIETGTRWCYGPGADSLCDFVASLASDVHSGAVVASSDGVAAAGGDGAAVRSYVAVPMGPAAEGAGVFCILDYRERAFSAADIRLVQEFAALAFGEVDRQKEIRSLKSSEERFRAVTENALDVVAIVDREGTFTYLSHAAAGIFGVKPEDGVGRSVYASVLNEDQAKLRDALKKGESADDVMDVAYRYIHPDGSLRYLRLRGKNLLRLHGVAGFLVNIRDATDRVQFEEELRKSRDRAEEMSRLKSVFLTNMSHEIRTPLTTILGFAEILEDEVGEDEQEFVHLIQQGGQRLLDTLMSILDLARLESSSFEIEPEDFDIAQKVWETCLLLEPLAQEKGLRLEVDVPTDPVNVFMDISAVERTVSNLVSNGIKFTSEGSVKLSMEVDEDDILIHVADTGIGISREFMPYLFDEFKQESEGLSRIHEGSGLGLPITKRLVELMKGEIMADSEKGRGSVFTVALPRNGAAENVPTNGHSDDAGTRARVLVVEDNADTRTLVNHLLRKSYEVVCASNGEEALSLAGESDYDVLLVDINLGKGKSGEDVLHEIKNLPGYGETPVVAVTAYAMPGDRERFFSEGFDDYVSKPFSKQRLLEALEGVLE